MPIKDVRGTAGGDSGNFAFRAERGMKWGALIESVSPLNF